MDLNVNYENQSNEESNQSTFQEFGLLIFILPISIFTPGFIFTNIIAYFKYLNSWQLWASSIIFSLLFLFLLRFLSKNWISTFIKYIISASLAAFILLLVFLFGLKSNFIIREVHRLFKNDYALELISNTKAQKFDIDIYSPSINEYQKLPPGEKELWLNGLQRYVGSKYNDEGKSELFNNLKIYFEEKDNKFKMEERLIIDRQSEGKYINLDSFYNKRQEILAYRKILLTNANKYFNEKTVFTNYDELFIFYSCFE